MDDQQVRQAWEQNAEAWTQLSRSGYNVCRDQQITPAFLNMLPPIQGLLGLDLGCGEGQSTRLLAARGAQMVALDIAAEFVRVAADAYTAPTVSYLVASARHLPFAPSSFDFVTAFMSLMDVGGPECSLPGVARVLKPSGFVQFSLLHPCFAPPFRKIVTDETGVPIALQVGRYFDRHDEIERWVFSSAPTEVKRTVRTFEVPRFHRTLGDWLNAIYEAGLYIEQCVEPRAEAEVAERYPNLADTRVAPNFLLLRCRLRNASPGGA